MVLSKFPPVAQRVRGRINLLKRGASLSRAATKLEHESNPPQKFRESEDLALNSEFATLLRSGHALLVDLGDFPILHTNWCNSC